MYNKIKFSTLLVILFFINLSFLLAETSSKSDQPDSPAQTQKPVGGSVSIPKGASHPQSAKQLVSQSSPISKNIQGPKQENSTESKPEIVTFEGGEAGKKNFPDLKVKQALQTSEGETFIAIGKGKVAPFLQHIINRGKLIVAMYSVDQPPFFMKDKDGKLIGLDVEIAAKMAEILGVDVEFNREAESFNEVVDIVSSGKADIGISKLSFTLVRSQKVLYTKPYIVLGKTFLINRLEMAKLNVTKKADTLNGLFNQPDRTIGVIKDSSYESFARQLFPQAKIVTLNSWGPETLELAVEGKILGVFRDDLEIKKLIRQKPDANLKVLPVTLKNQEDPIRIIVPWNQDHFVFWVNEFLQSMEISFTVDELLTKYSSYFQELTDEVDKAEKEGKVGDNTKEKNNTMMIDQKNQKNDSNLPKIPSSTEKPGPIEKKS